MIKSDFCIARNFGPNISLHFCFLILRGVDSCSLGSNFLFCYSIFIDLDLFCCALHRIWPYFLFIYSYMYRKKLIKWDASSIKII